MVANRWWSRSLRLKCGLSTLSIALGLVAAGTDAERLPARRAFAWTAEKDDTTVYLVGTVHAGTDSTENWPDEIELSWRRTSTLLVEADTTDTERIATLLRRYGMSPSVENTWGEHWTDELRERVRRVLGHLPSDVERLRPWLLAQLLTVAHLRQLGFNPELGIDARLIKRARRERRPIVEIEGAEQQFCLFADAPAEIQLAMLTDVLDDIESGEAARDLKRIMATCMAADFVALEEIYREFSTRSRPADQYLFRRLFVERHESMIAAIEHAAATDQRPLVAVGALHFVGPKGLLALLEQRGWRIKPLKVPANISAPSSTL